MGEGDGIKFCIKPFFRIDKQLGAFGAIEFVIERLLNTKKLSK